MAAPLAFAAGGTQKPAPAEASPFPSSTPLSPTEVANKLLDCLYKGPASWEASRLELPYALWLNPESCLG